MLLIFRATVNLLLYRSCKCFKPFWESKMTSKDWLRNFERSHVSFFFLIKTFQNHWPELGGVGFLSSRGTKTLKQPHQLIVRRPLRKWKGWQRYWLKSCFPLKKKLWKDSKCHDDSLVTFHVIIVVLLSTRTHWVAYNLPSRAPNPPAGCGRVPRRIIANAQLQQSHWNLAGAK